MMNAPLPDDPSMLKDLLMQQRRDHLHQIMAMQTRIQGLEDMATQTSAFQARIEMLEQKEQQLAQSLIELQRKNDDLALDKQRLEYRVRITNYVFRVA